MINFSQWLWNCQTLIRYSLGYFVCFVFCRSEAHGRHVRVNKGYIVDSALPESTSFTLVDTLHGLTMAFVFAVVACSAYVLKLIKKDKMEAVKLFDRKASRLMLFIYFTLNILFIYGAVVN